MKLIKAAIIASSLLFGFTGVASASSTAHHHDDKHHSSSHSGCGGSTPNTPTCTNQKDYSETFSTDNFKYDSYWNKYYGSFDAIDVPTLDIDSVVLTVNTNSNGWYDSFWLISDWDFDKIGSLKGGTQSFTLSSSWYDEVISGLSFKAWFSLDSEVLNWATLTVNGKYCAPSAVPVPAAIWLFGPAMLGFTAMRRRAKKA